MLELRAQLQELQEEVNSLTECLIGCGAVRATSLAKVKRQRNAVRVWQEVVSLPELCVGIAAKSGLAAARNLALASKVHQQPLREVLPVVREQIPAQLVIIGGSKRFAPLPGPGEEALVVEEVDVLDTTDDRWMPLTQMPQAIVGCAAAVLGGRIYAAGGQLDRCVLNTLFMFDPSAKEDWRALAQMSSRRSLCVTVAGGGFLYVTGGHDHMEQPRGSMEMYDPEVDRWTKQCPMPTARFACASTSLGSRMYICGGKSRLGAIRGTAEGFDFTSGTWFTLPPMPTVRAGCAAAALGSRLFVVGGEALPDSTGGSSLSDFDVEEGDLFNPGAGKHAFGVLEVFDTIEGTWSQLPSMPTPRGACAAATVGDRIYVLGGVSANSASLDVVECFDPVRCSWSTAPSLARPRSRCTAVALRR